MIHQLPRPPGPHAVAARIHPTCIPVCRMVLLTTHLLLAAQAHMQTRDLAGIVLAAPQAIGLMSVTWTRVELGMPLQDVAMSQGSEGG